MTCLRWLGKHYSSISYHLYSRADICLYVIRTTILELKNSNTTAVSCSNYIQGRVFNKNLSQKFMMTSPHEGLKRKGWDISGEDLCT